jgi:hypothetical protein
MNHFVFKLGIHSRHRYALSLVVMLLGIVGISVITQKALAKDVTKPVAPAQPSSQNAAQTDTIVKKLLGQWQTRDPKSNTQFTFIFAPENKLFMVLTAPDGSLGAIKLAYQVNSATQPMQMDIQISPEQKASTIFEFTSDGKLRLAIDGITPETPRPAKFKGDETVFARTSDATTLPVNIKVIEPEVAKEKTPADEVKTYMSALTQVQQARYREQGKFASTIEDVSIGLKTETDFYRYKFVPQKDDTKSVMITAEAKTAQLPSFTSAVFATQVNGKTTTVAQICATEKPSTKPPAMPSAPTTASSEIRCPAGSRSLISK